MKYIVALLLAANVGYFVWEYTRTAEQPREAYPPPGAERLALVDEAGRADAASEPPASEPDASAEDDVPPDTPRAVASAASPARPSSSRNASDDEDAGTDDVAQPGSRDSVADASASSDAAGTTSDPSPDAPQAVAPSPDTEEPTAARSSKPPNPSCYRLGPYFEQALVDRAASALSEHGITVQRDRGEADRLFGYWVYVPPREDRAGAQRVAEDLAANGMQDYFIVVSKEMENAISVGVFSKPESARRRRAQLSELGYETEVEPRFREAHATWLDVRVPEDVDLDETWWRIGPEQTPSLERRERECERGASSSAVESSKFKVTAKATTLFSALNSRL